jgi:hypothetical protein
VHKLIQSVWRTCADFPLMKQLFLETLSRFILAKIMGESSQNLVILGHQDQILWLQISCADVHEIHHVHLIFVPMNFPINLYILYRTDLLWKATT